MLVPNGWCQRHVQLGFEHWELHGPPWPKMVGFCDLHGTPYVSVSKIPYDSCHAKHFTQKVKCRVNIYKSCTWIFLISGVNWSNKMIIWSFFCIYQINLFKASTYLFFGLIKSIYSKLVHTCNHVIINNFYIL